MHTLYLFAPENDMALAFGGKYYTPTPVARGISHDLSQLPLWYAAEPCAEVLSAQVIDTDRAALLETLGITARCVTRSSVATARCIPWGWSAYMVERLARAGIDRALLPDEKAIATLRELSSRATTRTILQALSQAEMGYPLPPLPQILRSESEVQTYVESQCATMLKSPWSSSGRGVWAVRNGYDSVTARNAGNIIRRYGYIMGEQLQDKVTDMAMEFYSDGTRVSFAGYSLFETDARNAYQGNILAHDSDIENILLRSIDIDTLHRTRHALESILTNLIAPHYTGYMGVDMILYRNEAGKVLLHPCIELNLRMSMGMVAHSIAQRYLSPHSMGRYHVHYSADNNELQALHRRLGQEHPLEIAHRQIVSGYLALTPLLPNTHYMAYIVVKEK